MNRLTIFSIIIAVFYFTNSYAQIDTTKAPDLRITLSDGSQIFGRIESSETDFLNFITNLNIRIKIPKNQITEVIRVQDLYLPKKKAEKSVKDTIPKIPEVEYEDLNSNRMFLFPTAKPMRTGQAYLSFNELFFPFAAFGIEELIVIGAGSSILPGRDINQFYYISPRITPLKIGSFYLAGGIFYSKSFEGGSHFPPFGSGVIYGMTTYELTSSSFSFGLGWAYTGKNIADKPMMILGGESKIGTNTKFIIEAWVFDEVKVVVPFIGTRFYNKNVCFDIALIKPIVASSGFFLPWISITYNIDFFHKQ